MLVVTCKEPIPSSAGGTNSNESAWSNACLERRREKERKKKLREQDEKRISNPVTNNTVCRKMFFKEKIYCLQKIYIIHRRYGCSLHTTVTHYRKSLFSYFLFLSILPLTAAPTHHSRSGIFLLYSRCFF